MEVKATTRVDDILPRNRKKLPLTEALATSLNSVDIKDYATKTTQINNLRF